MLLVQRVKSWFYDFYQVEERGSVDPKLERKVIDGIVDAVRFSKSVHEQKGWWLQHMTGLFTGKGRYPC